MREHTLPTASMGTCLPTRRRGRRRDRLSIGRSSRVAGATLRMTNTGKGAGVYVAGIGKPDYQPAGGDAVVIARMPSMTPPER